MNVIHFLAQNPWSRGDSPKRKEGIQPGFTQNLLNLNYHLHLSQHKDDWIAQVVFEVSVLFIILFYSSSILNVRFYILTIFFDAIWCGQDESESYIRHELPRHYIDFIRYTMSG